MIKDDTYRDAKNLAMKEMGKTTYKDRYGHSQKSDGRRAHLGRYI